MESFLVEPEPEKPSIPEDPLAEKIGVDILGLEVTKDVNESANCIEFILITLSCALSIKPNQAAGMLAKDNFYLHEACVKGLKGGFDKLISWY